MVIELVGWLAAALGIASSLPQALRIYRVRSSAGVSLWLWQLTAAATASWAVHGYMVNSPQMQLPNVFLALMAMLTVVLVVRDRHLSLLGTAVLTVIVASALVGVDLTLGAAVFGSVVAIPQLVGQASQLHSMVKADDLRGVSVGYLAVALVCQSLWFGFGVLTVEWALIVCAGLMVLACVANLGYWAYRSARGRREQVVARAV